MKRLPTGIILLDTIDIICISASAGSGIAILIRTYRKYKGRSVEDPIVRELKKTSLLKMFSKSGKLVKLPLVRGGEEIKRLRIYSLLIKNKRLATLVRAIVNAKIKQKQLKSLQLCFLVLNVLLTRGVGLRFAIGGSLDYVQVLLIAFPSTVGGLMMGLASANPLANVLLPLAILYGRGIEDIPNPSEKCKAFCKVAEEFHNGQLTIQMEKLSPLVENPSTVVDKVHLLCVEQKLSLVERYKLKELIKSKKARKRVQHFAEFIKKFPECDPDPKALYEAIVEKIGE
jgi:hypothetical protein